MGDRLRSEVGVTLVELVVAMWLGLLVLIAGLVFLVTSLHQSNAVASRAVATRNAEAALQQLVRDLRQSMTTTESPSAQALTISSSGSTTTFSFSVPTPGNDTLPENVTWSCTGTTASPGWCTRTVGTATQTWLVGFESISFTNLSGTALTPPITTPSYLGITMNLQVTSQLDANQYKTTPDAKFTGASNPIAIQTAVDLRNQT
jgi:Tfp pilus assembly protein PilW